MVVDCGGGTVDLTTRELLPDNRLGEITESKGACCGGVYVDMAFLKLIAKQLHIPWDDMETIRAKHTSLIKSFFEQVFWPTKYAFTGDESEFMQDDGFEVDIEECFPVLIKYVPEAHIREMENNDWMIDISFQEMKAIFDVAVDPIIRLIG
jgi:hypothetical protein